MGKPWGTEHPHQQRRQPSGPHSTRQGHLPEHALIKKANESARRENSSPSHGVSADDGTVAAWRCPGEGLAQLRAVAAFQKEQWGCDEEVSTPLPAKHSLTADRGGSHFAMETLGQHQPNQELQAAHPLSRDK